MKFIVIILQVILYAFLAPAKLHLIQFPTKSEEIFKYTENTLNDTRDTNNNKSPVVDDVPSSLLDNSEKPADDVPSRNDGFENDDLITSPEEHEQQLKNILNVLVDAPLPSSAAASSSASPAISSIGNGSNKVAIIAPSLPLLWFTNQRPMRRKSANGDYLATTTSMSTTAFKSINEHSKLNKLKVFSSQTAGTKEEDVDEDAEDDKSFDGIEPQSFEINTNTKKAMLGSRPNVAVIDVYTPAPVRQPVQLHDDIVEASNNADNRQQQKQQQQHQPQQVNHLKFYKSNSLPPLSFGQLPQFLNEPKYQQQKQQPSLPQVHHTDAEADEDADGDDHHQQLQLQQQHQHPFADYRLLFNAERYTEFYLYTLTKPHEFTQRRITLRGTRPPAQDNIYSYSAAASSSSSLKSHHHSANSSMPQGGGRILNVVSDTIGAAFGVNAPPVADLEGICLEQLQLYNARSLRQSRFNPFNPTRILIHGWLGGSTAGLYNTLIPELLKLKNGTYNVITVDWGKGAIADYITASYRVKPVGKVLAKFIDFLHQESGVLFEDIALIGFSMGAHVAGISGKYVQTGRLSKIYALDPALPLFRYENIRERVDRSDADYVEVLHTSVGSYGYDRPLGHVDFYVNFGSSQPGCYFKECSHFRAFQIFSQSLGGEKLQGIGCSPEMWPDMIKMKRCIKETGSKLTINAENLTTSATTARRGVYYVLTNSYPPYKL